MDPHQAAPILDLKRGWAGIENAKMAHDHCYAPLFNNDKRYDSERGKDLAYFNFPRNKQNRKRTLSFDCMIYFEYVFYALPASFKSKIGTA